MLNKKSQAVMEFLLTYGWTIMVVLACIGASAYFGMSYDSEKHICEEKCEINCVGEGCVFVSCVGVKGNKNYYDGECMSWRKKIKCELNIEAEGCICDEWEKELMYCLINKTYKLILKNGIETIFFVKTEENREKCYPFGELVIDDLNMEIIDTVKIIEQNIFNKTIKKRCVKAHEPNECELGNEHYMIDNLTNECRLNTIDDYSCDILKKIFFIKEDIFYIPSKDEWKSGCFTFKRKNCLTTTDLKLNYIKKGCEI